MWQPKQCAVHIVTPQDKRVNKAKVTFRDNCSKKLKGEKKILFCVYWDKITLSYMKGRRLHGSNPGRSRKALKYQIWLWPCVSWWKLEWQRDAGDMCNFVQCTCTMYMKYLFWQTGCECCRSQWQFSGMYEICFPLTTTKLNRNIHRINGFMTPGLLISRITKNKLHKQSLIEPSPVNVNKFKTYRNLFNTLIRKSKTKFYEDSWR